MISIRRAGATDAENLNTLMHASSAYQAPYDAILRGYKISLPQILRDEMHLAADTAGRILGFYSLTGLASEPELDLMFTADAVQGMGLGARLFQHMRSTALAYGAARVKIVSHPPAEGFYLRMGAHRVGSILPSGRVGWVRPLLYLETAGT